ncbi:MAG: efflux RND transporter periplasmic adaptor subunit [Chloroflexota bacterium]|nr:efflux RND transporter periplasmic adaptor subunit [Chloroflexota bacterium]
MPTSNQSTSNTQPAQTSTSSSAIHIGKVVRGDLAGVLNFTAPVENKGEVQVIPRVVARLDKLDVDIGSRVHAGDVLAELDHTELDQQVLTAQAAQANAEAKQAALQAGPKPEVLAAAQASFKASQARVTVLQSARDNADIAMLDQRVKDARAALDQAQAALEPDAQAVSQAEASAADAKNKLAQLQADPTKANDKTAMDAARTAVQKADAAVAAARTPRGTQAAADRARLDLQDAQQAQLMARLSTTAFDLDQARALLDVADAQLKLANAPASPEELKAAQSTVEEAFAQAELARSHVRDATVTAPITGVVAEIRARVGATVGPSAAVLTLIPPDMQVVVRADESQLSQVQVGQSASLSVESFPKDAFAGTVKGIAPVLDVRTRSVAVQIDVPDPQGKLKPGMFAQLAIQVGQRPGALTVPKESILKVGSVDPMAPTQTVVYSVLQSRVHKQVVSLGASDGKNVEIVQGLQEGSDVVLNPRPDFLEGELISAT